MARALVVTILILLAGCAASPDPVIDETPPLACAAEGVCGQNGQLTEDGRDLRTDLTTADVVKAPKWARGDVFEQHLFLGSRDAEGTHIQTVVIDTSGGYRIATPDEASARYEAVYDLPVLGDIGPGLETTAFGADWSWMYDFPLSDGKTWTASVEQLMNWNTYSFTDYDLTMTVSYEANIDTPKGDFPGFWIEAITQDGDKLARYNYVPAIGWFSHFWLYDLDNGGDSFMLHAMSMGTSKNYTGAYFEADATTVIEHFQGVFPDPAGPVQGDPAPQDFQVQESDRFMGFIVPIAVGGQMDVTLTDPNGVATTYGYQQLGMDGPGFQVAFIDDEPIVGGWQMRAVGAGVATGVYLWLNTVTLTGSTL